MITAVDHVQLAAPPGSEERLRAYYAGVLGLTEVPKPPVLAARGGCWFTGGAVTLHLGVEPGFRPSAKAHPGLRVRDIEAFAHRLAAHGAKVVWDDNLPGHQRFYSEDPVGNRLEFLAPNPQDPPPPPTPQPSTARAPAPAAPTPAPAVRAGGLPPRPDTDRPDTDRPDAEG